MKQILTILWVIIITGSIFISIHLFKPESKIEEEIEKLTDVEATEDIIIKETPLITSNKEIPQTYTEYMSAGDQYLEDGYPEKAVENYQRAAEVNPNSSEAIIKLGEAFLKTNDPSKAKETFELALELNRDSTIVKLNIARAHLNSREFEEAKKIVWELDATDYKVQYYKAIISILYKDFETAKDLFTAITSIDPALNATADPILIENSQKFVDAFTTFSYYNETDPIFLESLLAKALTDTEEYEASIPFLFEIINKKNNYRDAWIVLGYAYLNINKAEDAVDALLQAKALNPQHPQTLFFLGLAYFANNEIDKAIAYIEAADKAGYEPKDQINLKLGDLYLLKEKYGKSAQKYENVISLNPKNIEIFVHAVWLNIDKINKPEKALELALKSIENHPENAMSYNLTGWAYTALGDYENAKNYLKKALSTNKNFDAAHLNLGWLYEKQGLSIMAKEYYKKAYILGKGNSIGNLAAIRFNRLTKNELQKYYQVDISAP